MTVVDQREFFRLLHHGAVFQIEIGRADDTRQGRAQVMRDGSQQICTHFFIFCRSELLFPLGEDACLLFQVRGRSAGDKGDNEHDQKGKRITIHCEVQVHVRIGEEKIDAHDAQQGADDTVEVAGRIACDKDDDQNI